MADQQPTHAPPPAAPWYARLATTAGRPAVLAATLVMSMPGEYHVARFAGWSDPWAYGMPFSLSAYAGIAAVVAATRPAGARGRASATIGAALAIVLALAAQVVAHLAATGHMNRDQAWLIAVVSMVPPAVLAHLLHLAATPTQTTAAGPSPVVVEQPVEAVVERVDAPPLPVAPPRPAVEQGPPAAVQPTPVEPEPLVYADPRCHAVRPLYDNGTRPGTATMRDAIVAAGHRRPSDSVIRGNIRAEIEQHEPRLRDLPAEATPLHRAG